MRGRYRGLGGWQKNSFIDFPGTVSTVLFFSGCNLRCPYCHNPALACGEGHDDIDGDEVRRFLEARKGFIQGVVLSGGEPTIHAHLSEMVAEIRSLGYRVKLDSNGLLPDRIADCRPDYLALDVKTAPERYPELLGARVSDIDGRLRRSIALVRDMGTQAEIRVTVAPGLIDADVIEVIAGMLEGVSRVFVQPMQQRHELLDPAMNDAQPIDDGELMQYRDVLASRVGECRIRGVD